MELVLTKGLADYAEGIQKLAMDLKKEAEQGIKDGLIYTLGKQEDDEMKVYEYIKNEGYVINYKDFQGFIGDARAIINENEAFFMNIVQETFSEELSEDDLEQVAGGGWFKNNWKKVLMGIGALMVVAAIGILTCGVGLAAITGAAAAVGQAVGVLATITTASTLIATGLIVGAAGTTAIIVGASK